MPGIRMLCNKFEEASSVGASGGRFVKPFLVAVACGPNRLYL
jgi:hypothetical protein